MKPLALEAMAGEVPTAAALTAADAELEEMQSIVQESDDESEILRLLTGSLDEAAVVADPVEVDKRLSLLETSITIQRTTKWMRTSKGAARSSASPS